jgi:hypothetical protein
MGPNGAVGLNILAVDLIFNYMDVPVDEREALLSKIQMIASSCLNSQYQEAERRQRQASKK